MFNMEFDDEVLSRELENSSLFSQFVDMENENVTLFDIQELTCVTSTEQVTQTSTDAFVLNRETRTTPVVKQHREPKRKGDVKRGASTTKQRPTSRNAARERSRVKSLRSAFLELQNSLPSVPRNTKLSKLDVLVLATTYIAHLMKTLDEAKYSTEEVGGATSISTFANIPADLGSVATTISRDNPCPSELRQHRLHEKGYLHPVRKWPMRSRLYAGAFEEKRCFSVLPQVSLEESNCPVSEFDPSFDGLFNFATQT